MTDKEFFLKIIRDAVKEMCGMENETNFYRIETDGGITIINENNEETTFLFDDKGCLFHYG